MPTPLWCGPRCRRSHVAVLLDEGRAVALVCPRRGPLQVWPLGRPLPGLPPPGTAMVDETVLSDLLAERGLRDAVESVFRWLP